MSSSACRCTKAESGCNCLARCAASCIPPPGASKRSARRPRAHSPDACRAALPLCCCKARRIRFTAVFVAPRHATPPCLARWPRLQMPLRCTISSLVAASIKAPMHAAERGTTKLNTKSTARWTNRSDGKRRLALMEASAISSNGTSGLNSTSSRKTSQPFTCTDGLFWCVNIARKAKGTACAAIAWAAPPPSCTRQATA
mmetsp:Transcript_51338/g.104442  ORF Transcript_51338/g.104442 Transcript_51338/m.104442 type:complete len:200 (+) Transcript_51338:67-666(+)